MESETKKPNLFFQEMTESKGRDSKTEAVKPESITTTSDQKQSYAQSLEPKMLYSSKQAVEDIQKTERVSTGISGIDSMTEGGFRKGTVNLVSGGPGAGKSIFGMQFLVTGIEKRGEAGIYITFEEEPHKLLGNYAKFKWPLKKYIEENQLAILEYTPEQVQNLLLSGGGTIREIIDSVKAKNIVIDSLTAFSLLHETEIAKRRAILQLFTTLWKWGLTAVVIDEHDMHIDDIKSNLLEFEVDAVIHLYNIKKGDVRERALEVLKMRATQHSSRIIPMKISEEGITVYPEEIVF